MRVTLSMPFLALLAGACSGVIDSEIPHGAGLAGSTASDGRSGERLEGGAGTGVGGSAGSIDRGDDGATGLGGMGGQGGGTPTGSGGAAGAGGTAGAGGAAGSGGTAGRGGAVGQGGTMRPDGSAVGSGGTARPDAGSPGTARLDGAVTILDAGLAEWTTGYVATMYGNSASGDCAGYPFFSDATSIRTGTCSRVVTLATFAAGVVNNSSYYGATGDLSSLWAGATCTCGGGDTCTGTQVPSCPAEQQAGGNCGICVAVKCDPAGSFALGNTTHNQDCSRTQFAVVQIIDACPHNHPTNLASSEGWCTTRQPNHIDLSCSALGGISTKGMNIGQDGWLNVAVQQVDCSIGLGLHAL